MTRSVVFAIGIFATLFSAASLAKAANAEKGKELARSLCSSCHIVGPGEAPPVVNADIPSFMAIAARQGQSAERIETFVINPHPVMPKIQLTKRELEAVAAYIMSLKPN